MLRLRFSKPREDYTNVIACVESALQLLLHHVQIEHLDIALPVPRIPISPFIFCCTNLVVLKLEEIRFQSSISSVNFPLLKTLHLQVMLFAKYECLAQLLSGCPVLEDFKECHVFFAGGFWKARFYMLSLPKLVRAEVSANHSFLLNAVSNVKYLHIRQIHDPILHNDGSTNPSVLPMFHNLIHIELSYSIFYKDWLEVVEVLKHCPQLQALVINQPNFHLVNIVGFEGELRDGQCPQSVPKCILLHLKRCYINDYRGTQGEFQFARYILQNGRFLESMTICSGADIDQQGKLENLIELSSCTRQSATCKLSFKR